MDRRKRDFINLPRDPPRLQEPIEAASERLSTLFSSIVNECHLRGTYFRDQATTPNSSSIHSLERRGRLFGAVAKSQKTRVLSAKPVKGQSHSASFSAADA